jgi:hypothetical protein
MQPTHLIWIVIDGMRPDVLSDGLEARRLPNLARLLGGVEMERGLLFPLAATAPSITFTSQASLFTGAHPGQHGVPGNQFFDRFGRLSKGEPRHFAFDVGDTLEVDDAIQVFRAGLASRCLQAPTIYEQLDGGHGWGNWSRAAVIGHMYARGAQTWRPPPLLNLARFTKGGNLFGMDAGDFDRQNLEMALEELDRGGLPDVLTVYFMGLDHQSHHHSPAAQLPYLSEVLDPMIGELWEAVHDLGMPDPDAFAPLWVICSDHGQIESTEDDRHSLRLGFPFDRELGHFFDALGLDVHDFPGEDPDCDAVVSLNGGLAHVYLQNHWEHWSTPPDFEHDVLRVGRAFWGAHMRGRYAPELESALAAVLVRNVHKQGWQVRYQALDQKGDLVDLETWFVAQPAGLYLDPVHRLNNLAGPLTGDIVLLSNLSDGYYFGSPLEGVHGGLHPEDSRASLALGWPAASQAAWEQASAAFAHAIQQRCKAEGGRQPATADLLTGLKAIVSV